MWLIGFVQRLPIADETRRALVESLTDHYYERRGGFIAVVRVAAAACAALIRDAHPFRFLGHDLRAAGKRLRQSPGFSIFSIATLAIGIGAVAAVYSVISATLYQPLAFNDPAAIVNIYGRSFDGSRSMGRQLALSESDVEDLRAQQTVFSGVLAWERTQSAWTTDVQTSVALGEKVSGNYFEVLGVRAAIGRLLQTADDQPDAPAVVVLSHDAWTRQFFADAAIVGRRIAIDGTSFEVVGVTAENFRGVDMPAMFSPRGWITFAGAARTARRPVQPSTATRRDFTHLSVKGRLKPGVTIEAAAAQMRTIGDQLEAAYPRESTTDTFALRQRQFSVFRAQDIIVQESIHPIARIMASMAMTALMLVLLIACTNIANLQLGRLSGRRGEIAVRLALGASRARVVREITLETFVVACVGAAGGWLVAWWLTSAMTTGIETVGGVVVEVHPRLDTAVFAAITACLVLATIVAGLAPAWHIVRATRNGLAGSASAQFAARWRGRRFIVAAQVAVSVLLLALAAVFGRRAVENFSRDPGVDYARLTAVQFELRGTRDSEAQTRERLDRLAAAVQARPDVQDVFLSSGLPIGFYLPFTGVKLDMPSDADDPGSRYPALLAATSRVFPALGLKVTSGRTLNDRDAEQPELVCVIGRSLADKLFDRRSAVGERIFLRQDNVEPVNGRPWTWKSSRIVGVMEDVDVSSIGQRYSSLVIVPFGRWPVQQPLVGARMTHRATSATWLKDLVIQTDRSLPYSDARTGESLLNVDTMFARLGAALTSFMGAAALALGLVGLSGVLGHIVSSRTREIGIRMALGANASVMQRMVIIQGLQPVAAGIVVGALLAGVTVRATGSFIDKLGGLSPSAMVSIVIALSASAVVACYFPARRAARVDPNVALRDL